MFHDKIIGFTEDDSIIFNLANGRWNIAANKKSLEYLSNIIRSEMLISNLEKTFGR